MSRLSAAVKAALADSDPVTVLDEVARAIYHPSPTPATPVRDGYLHVSLIVKAGYSSDDILRARTVAVRHLNEWFIESNSDTPPYEVGALLSYSVHDDEDLPPIARQPAGRDRRETTG